MRKFFLGTAIFLGSFCVQAAEVTVAPGLGTLNAAVVAAESGDTLILQDGSYRMLGMTIDKSLTIKAQTNNNPIIVPDNGIAAAHRAVSVGGSDPIDLTIVGVTLAAMQFSTLNNSEDISMTIVECNLTGYPSSITDGFHVLENLTVIGNTFSGTPWSFHAERMVIAGNTFNLPSSNSFGHMTLTARHQSHFIGNELNSIVGERWGMLALSGQTHFVLANRIIADVSQTGSKQDAQYRLINVAGDVNAVIKNNLMRIKLPDEFQPDPLDPLTATTGISILHALDVATTNKTTVFENNTIDFLMDADDINFRQSSPVIQTDSPITVRNNVVVNASQELLGFTNADSEVNSVVEFNLCNNVVADTCYGDEVVAGDALFVDNIDYVAAAGSAAIDAGDTDGVFNDVDGSRNDLGAYGGTFPIDQYDVQRTNGRLEPYLYPLFEPNKAVSSDGKLNVRMIGLARSK